MRELRTAFIRAQHCGLNLSFEDFFLRSADDAEILYLFFYENRDALVLGKSLELSAEVHTHKRHPPVYRRISGGGSVLHTPGNLNYAFFFSLAAFPEMMNVSASYAKILSGVKAHFPRHITIEGYSDLSIRVRGRARKFSGNAQCRKRGWVMHHGTLLYDRGAIRRIPYFLKSPPKQPQYREGRGHRDFMTNVLPYYSRSRLMLAVRQGLAAEFSARLKTITDPLAVARTKMNPPFQSETVQH